MSISYDGERKDWGRWGEQDEIGRANLLDDALVAAAAAACIRTGKRFSLALPLFRPDGDPVLPGRPPARHVMDHDESYYADGRSAPLPGGTKYAEDSITLPCHGTTHMDALGHAWCGDQLWNGHPARTTAGGLTRASIGALAERGIVGRAVLADLPRHEGTPHLEMHRQITVGDVEDALAAQHTELRRGDILLLRTGIFRVFYEDGPEAFYADFDEPGLTYEPGLIDFVVEHDIAGLGTDTMCNEQAHNAEFDADFPLHVLLQRNLGVSFHEALWLEDWAADCAQDRVFDAFYVAAPLRIARGTGSPMNPIVIKLGLCPLEADLSYDVAAVRAHFPALKQGAAHFDGPGGSQVPDVVGDAVRATLLAAIANRGRVTAAERTAEDTVQAARQAVADLLGLVPRGVVFGRSMTQLTFDFSRALAKTWRPGDEVVVTRLDHDANIRPWVYAAEAAGATLRWADFDPATGELSPQAVASVLTERTRLVALTGASNLIGTRPDLRAVADLVHPAGGLVYVDGVHLTAHRPIDVGALGADFFGCSPYKFLGPHCGVIGARPELLEQVHPDKLLPATEEVPERFEFGTLPYELLAGTTAAIDFLASLAPAPSGSRKQDLVSAMSAVEAHEDRLRDRIERHVLALPGVTVWSRAARRTPTLLLTFADRDAREAYQYLATLGVNAPAGSFYALEASRWLGLGDDGGLRVGLAPYNNDEDVDRLLDGLDQFVS